MANWEKDNFLSEFLCDTQQLELDNYTGIGECLSSNPAAADESLTRYLSGNVLEDDTNSTDSHGRNTSSQNSLMNADDKVNERNQQIIVVTRPSPISERKRKGNSSSKEAIAARENREKKKQYVSSLETMVGSLKEENKMLKKQNLEQKQQVQLLQREVSYLKGVIANDSALSTVLTSVMNGMKNTEGLRISSSFFKGADKTVFDSEKQPQTGSAVPDQKHSLLQSESASGNLSADTAADIGGRRLRSKAKQLTTEEHVIPRKRVRLTESMDRDPNPSNQQLLMVTQKDVRDNTFAVQLVDGDHDASSSWSVMDGSGTFLHDKRNPKPVGSDLVFDYAINNGDLDSITDTRSDLADQQCHSLLPPGDSVLNEVCLFSDESVVRSFAADHAYTKN